MSPLADLLSRRTPFARAIGALLAVVAWALTFGAQNDPDFWWHLRVAEWVRDHGDVPRADFLSYQVMGEPWVAHSYLYDMVMSALYAAGGLPVVGLLSVVSGGAFVLLLRGLLREVAPTLAPSAAGLLLVAAVVIGMPVFSPRAQVVDVVFLLFALRGWIAYLRRGERRDLALMIPIAALWANLHGSGIGAYWLGAAAVVATLLLRRLARRSPEPPVRPLLVGIAAAIGAMCANPYGPALLGYPFETIFSPAQSRLIEEWLAPALSDLDFLGLRFALLLVPLLLAASRRRPPLLVGLLAAGWGFLALGSGRYVLFAAPFLILAVAPALDELHTRLLARLAGDPDGLPSGPRLPALATLLVIPAMLGIGAMELMPDAVDRALVKGFPVASVDAMLARGCHGPIWNEYGFGGYLAYRWREPVRVYGAADSLGDELLLAYGREARGTTLAAALERDRITLALVTTDSPAEAVIRELPGWARVASDRVGALYARDGACR